MSEPASGWRCRTGSRGALERASAWLLGAALLFAGVLKAADLVAASPAQHSELPEWYVRAAQLAALPELVVGALLLRPSVTRPMLVVACEMFVVFTAVSAAVALVYGAKLSCECLGAEFHVPIYWHFIMNGVCMTLAGLSLSASRGAR